MHKFVRLVTLAYTLFVTIIMLIPISGSSEIHIPYFDKMVHCGIYAVYVFLWLWYFWGHNKENKKAYFLVPIALCIYGIVIEILQGRFVATRTEDFWDVIANSIGILIGLFVFYKAKDIFLVKK
ncbi:MAG: VanZ family protein [Flavobacteriaceae bacterium]